MGDEAKWTRLYRATKMREQARKLESQAEKIESLRIPEAENLLKCQEELQHVAISKRSTETLEERLTNFMQARKHEHHRENNAYIIIPTQTCHDGRCHASAELTREFGGRARPYRNIPYVSLEVHYKEEDKIIQAIRKEGYDWLASHDIEPSSLAYNPDVIRPVLDPRPRHISSEALWNLVKSGAIAAHEITRGEGAVIGIIDTGADYTHPEIKHRFGRDKGWNYVDDNAEVMDQDEHGTHCSGISAGKQTGVAPASMLKIFVVLNGSGYGSTANVMHALDDCITDRVDAVNMSLGSLDYLRSFDQLCRTGFDQGVLTSAAAGNEYLVDKYSYPAAYHGVFGVAAIDREDNHVDFSNQNDRNDGCAYGAAIWSCVPGGYTFMSGTSMAAPHVTGAFALIRSMDKQLTAEQVFRIIMANTKKVGTDRKKFGAGLVRPDYALRTLQSIKDKYEHEFAIS